MEEETKVQITLLPNKSEQTSTQSNKWLFFKNQYEDIPSKMSMKERFYNEYRANTKRLRSNKKNPTKSSKYYSSPDSPNPYIGEMSKSEDHIYQTAIPNTITYTYEGMGSRIYNCKFTNDGERILVTSQTGTAFFKFSDDNKIELNRVIACSNVSWAITDSDVTTDNKFMIHSTLSPHVHMFDVEKSKYVKQFNFRTGHVSQEDEDDDDRDWFSRLRIFSLKFSSDNKEVIAACGRNPGGAPIQVFDIEQNKVKHSIKAHADDINSICYLERESSSIFVSGSDDGKCKLWDTRILKNNEPVGIFHGHISGLTCVNTKGDGRYFISNSKDQSIKLWDIRKSTTENRKHPMMSFDYRYGRPETRDLNLMKEAQKKFGNLDQSVMTFWGHSISGTLIRCHFSPLIGTGQRYVYSGSSDGRVYIYDTINGENIACLNLPKQGGYNREPVIRDCAWHPFSQNLISTSFDGEVHRWEHMDLRDSEKIEECEDEWESEEEEEEGIYGYRGYRGLGYLLGGRAGNANVVDDDDDDDEEYFVEDDDEIGDDEDAGEEEMNEEECEGDGEGTESESNQPSEK